MHETVSALCKNATKRISENHRISECLLWDILQEIATLNSKNETPFKSNEAVMLFKKLQDIYTYDMYDGYSSFDLFSMGAMWGAFQTCITSLEMLPENVLKKRMEILQEVENHIEILSYISSNPGCTSTNISKNTGELKRSVEKKIKNLAPLQLVSVSIQGNIKHYYPTKKLEDVFDPRTV